MFVAVARIPDDPASLPKAAAIAGLAPVDAARLMTGTLPRVLVRGTKEGPRLVAALEAAGFIAFAAEPSAIPTDRHRVVVRNLTFTSGGFVVVDTRGQEQACPAAALAAFLRGIRHLESSETVKHTEHKLDIGKAILTSGLAITKKVEITSERRTSSREPFLLIQRNDGQPALMLYEQRLNYQGLGAGLQPSRAANFLALLARLRTLAPAAPLDDRILRPGFLTGLPPLAADPADLALFLVSEAMARGC
ncbi:MAG: hypothetical protein KGI56_02815 [Acidobacteriota bacterium]|nr:hypothetical protein [Acidobacteriota bacterium]